MSVDVVTFGCRLNIAESEAIRIAAAAAGVTDAVVVNSCAVTGAAVKQTRQAIRRARRDRPAAEIIATGCAAQIDPSAFAAMPEVTRVLGNQEKLTARAWTDRQQRVAVDDIMATDQAVPHRFASIADHTRAFVPVQTGCDHRCTFCVIPFGRGNSRSVAPDEVVSQIRRSVQSGCREVVLTGVDLTDYRPGLGALVKRILHDVPDLPRLRVSSIDSVEADADLLDALADSERLMPHLHLSLQSGDDLILKRMKRRHSRGEAVAFCERVRRLRPDVVFGADIIAGFPTETEAMFASSLDLVGDCGLTHLHVFPFSPRPGTPAARMPPVDPFIVRERAERLRLRGGTALVRYLDAEVGQRRTVLAERGGLGRTPQFTPVRFKASVAAGAILDIEVAGHDGRALLAA